MAINHYLVGILCWLLQRGRCSAFFYVMEGLCYPFLNSYSGNMVKQLVLCYYLRKCKHGEGSNHKSNLHNTRAITPKRVTSGGAHLRCLTSGWRSSEKRSRRWRLASHWQHCVWFGLLGNRIPASRTDSDILNSWANRPVCEERWNYDLIVLMHRYFFAGDISSCKQVTSASSFRDVQWHTQTCSLGFSVLGKLKKYFVKVNKNFYKKKKSF